MDEKIIITEKLIDDCLDYLSKNGKKPGTIDTYRSSMRKLYRHLPEPKEFNLQDIKAWQDGLIRDGLSEQYALQYASAAKILYKYAAKNPTIGTIPEFDYQRLLSAAKNERDELLIRIYASMDINVRDTAVITVEACRAGRINKSTFPTKLRSDLLAYAEHQGISSGPIFLNCKGNPTYRTGIARMVTRTAKRAGLEPALCHPSALRRMVRRTQKAVRANMQPVYAEFLKSMQQIEADLTAAAGPTYG